MERNKDVLAEPLFSHNTDKFLHAENELINLDPNTGEPLCKSQDEEFPSVVLSFKDSKLQDFVEGDDVSVTAAQHTVQIPPIRPSFTPSISRLSFNNRASVSAHRPKQSIFLASGLNFNYEDVMEDVVNIEDNQLTIQRGDYVKKMTIKPSMLKYLGNSFQQKVSDIQKPTYQNINQYLAWFLVFYATINGACIPPWIMSIPAEKYIRISWRFFMQSFMMIPFLLYERRNLPANLKYQYTLSHIFKLEHIKKVYMVAFTNSIWFTMVLFAFEWSYISHALVLSGLQQFCFSINRHVNKNENHNYESAGQAMVIFGVLCVITDSITFDSVDADPNSYLYRNKLVNFRKPWQRVIIGNGTALLVSFLMFRMSRHQGESRKVYPQYLSMALVFAFTSLNMTMSSYFFAGSDLVQHDSFWGWSGLFTSTQFSGFLFMSIILGMGNFITQTLISKIFEPIIPATVALFEPIFSTIILQLVGVQIIPRGLACLGYVFILPGLFVIIIGQHLIMQRNKQNEELALKEALIEEIERQKEKDLMRQLIDNPENLQEQQQLVEAADEAKSKKIN